MFTGWWITAKSSVTVMGVISMGWRDSGATSSDVWHPREESAGNGSPSTWQSMSGATIIEASQ